MATTKAAGGLKLSRGGAMALLKSLGDALTGGNGTVEVAPAVALPGRQVMFHLSAEEVSRYLVDAGWERKPYGEPEWFLHTRHGHRLLVPNPAEHEAPALAAEIATVIGEIADCEDRHPVDVAEAILARRGGVERAACGKHDAATGSGIGWQSWCPGCNPTLHRDESAAPAKASVAVRHALLTVRDEIAEMPRGWVSEDPRAALRSAEKVVQRHLANASGADSRPAIDAAICRIVAVAPPVGVREDEVLRFLVALELDDDLGETRLAALVAAGVLTWHEQKGKPDAPMLYRRGPKFGEGAR